MKVEDKPVIFKDEEEKEEDPGPIVVDIAQIERVTEQDHNEDSHSAIDFNFNPAEASIVTE